MTNAALADAVLAMIAPMVTAASGTTQRKRVPRLDLKDLATLQATVVPPRNEDWNQAARASWYRDRQVDISIQKQVADDAAADTLDAWVETLSKFVAETQVHASQSLVSIKVMSYEPMTLDEKKVFFAVVTPIYRELFA